MLISAVQQSDSVIHIYILFHYGFSQDIEYGSLWYIVGTCCLYIVCIIVASANPRLPVHPSLSYGFSLGGLVSLQGTLRRRECIFLSKKYGNCDLFYNWVWLQTSKSGRNRSVGKSASGRGRYPSTDHTPVQMWQPVPWTKSQQKDVRPLQWGLEGGIWFCFSAMLESFLLEHFWFCLGSLESVRRNSWMFEGKWLTRLASL